MKNLLQRQLWLSFVTLPICPITLRIRTASALSSSSIDRLQRPRVQSCSCGEVELVVNSPPLQICHCHCAGCRAATGAAFSTWGCVPLLDTHFEKWSTLKVHQRQPQSSTAPRANRYFCGECGCSVAMNYPATGGWPEPNTLWLSAAFLGEDAFQVDSDDAVVHMYPEERPEWCTIDRAGCTVEDTYNYMGADHVCVVRDDEPYDNNAVLWLGGKAGKPRQDSAKSVQAVPASESFRLRGVIPTPMGLPGSVVLGQERPPWVTQNDVSAAKHDRDSTRIPEFRVRPVSVSKGLSVSIFEMAKDEDGCDVDSPNSSLCGGILWPGARSAAEMLLKRKLEGLTVMEMGAGTGLGSLVAALLGAKDVLATDASTATLELIEAAAAAQNLGVVRTSVLNLLTDKKAMALPDQHVDIAIAADLLYTEELARAVARMCGMLSKMGTELIVTDSQNRWVDAFLEELSTCTGRTKLPSFRRRKLGFITGWSYAEGGDATHEVTVNVLEM